VGSPESPDGFPAGFDPGGDGFDGGEVSTEVAPTGGVLRGF